MIRKGLKVVLSVATLLVFLWLVFPVACTPSEPVSPISPPPTPTPGKVSILPVPTDAPSLQPFIWTGEMRYFSTASTISYGLVNWRYCLVLAGISQFQLRMDSKIVYLPTGQTLAATSVMTPIKSAAVHEGEPTPEPVIEVSATWEWEFDWEAYGYNPAEIAEFTRGVYVCIQVDDPCLVRYPDNPDELVEAKEVIIQCGSDDGSPPDAEGYCFTGYPFAAPLVEFYSYLPYVYVSRGAPLLDKE